MARGRRCRHLARHSASGGACTARAVAGTAQLHRPGTATSPSTQLRVPRSPGASAGILSLEGAAGYLPPALGAARSLNGMRAASPRDPGRRGAPERPGLHAPTEDHPESTAIPNADRVCGGSDGRERSVAPERAVRSASTALSSQVMLPLRLGEAAGEFTDVTGADQLAHARVTGRRQCPVIACCAATPDSPLRVLAPEPLEPGILVARARASGHGRQWQAATQVTGG